MGLEEYHCMKNEHFDIELSYIINAEVRRWWPKLTATPKITNVDHEVFQDFLDDTAYLIVSFYYEAKVLDTPDKTWWHRYKLKHPELTYEVDPGFSGSIDKDDGNVDN